MHIQGSRTWKSVPMHRRRMTMTTFCWGRKPPHAPKRGGTAPQIFWGGRLWLSNDTLGATWRRILQDINHAFIRVKEGNHLHSRWHATTVKEKKKKKRSRLYLWKGLQTHAIGFWRMKQPTGLRSLDSLHAFLGRESWSLHEVPMMVIFRDVLYRFFFFGFGIPKGIVLYFMILSIY